MFKIASFFWMDEVIVVFLEATVNDKIITKIIVFLFDFLADSFLECVEKCFKCDISAFTTVLSLQSFYIIIFLDLLIKVFLLTFDILSYVFSIGSMFSMPIFFILQEDIVDNRF